MRLLLLLLVRAAACGTSTQTTWEKDVRPLMEGDELKLSCSWNNSAGFQPVIDGRRSPPRGVNWGEGTGDESCLGILYVSE